MPDALFPQQTANKPQTEFRQKNKTAENLDK